MFILPTNSPRYVTDSLTASPLPSARLFFTLSRWNCTYTWLTSPSDSSCRTDRCSISQQRLDSKIAYTPSSTTDVRSSAASLLILAVSSGTTILLAAMADGERLSWSSVRSLARRCETAGQCERRARRGRYWSLRVRYYRKSLSFLRTRVLRALTTQLRQFSSSSSSGRIKYSIKPLSKRYLSPYISVSPPRLSSVSTSSTISQSLSFSLSPPISKSPKAQWSPPRTWTAMAAICVCRGVGAVGRGRWRPRRISLSVNWWWVRQQRMKRPISRCTLSTNLGTASRSSKVRPSLSSSYSRVRPPSYQRNSPYMFLLSPRAT